MELGEALDSFRCRDVDLVDDEEFVEIGCPYLAQHLAYRRDLPVGIPIGCVYEVQQHVGFVDFFECRTERFDEFVGQPPHEADGVRHQRLPAPLQLELADGGVEGGKQSVLHQHIGIGQRVEESGLAGVGIAHDGNNGQSGTSARLGSRVPGAVEVAQLTLELGDAILDSPPVRFELCLTWPPGAYATPQPAQLGSASP